MKLNYFRERSEKLQYIVLILILIFALVSMSYWVTYRSAHTLTDDEKGYSSTAQQLLNKGYLGYLSDRPNAYVTPGYPLFLAGVFKVTQIIGGLSANPLMTTRYTQILFSLGTILFVFLMGKRLGKPWAGLLAALLLAAYQPTWHANSRILTESLYTFLLVAYIYSVLVLLQSREKWQHGLTGVLLAITVLVRPSIAPVIVIPYLLDFWQHRDWRFTKGFVITLLCFGVVMLPWWIRNYYVTNQMVVFATESGNPFLRGTDPYDPYDKIGPSIIKNVPEKDMTKVGLQRIENGLKKNPGLWIKWYTVGKLKFMWKYPWGRSDLFKYRFYHLLFVVIIGWVGLARALLSPSLRWLAAVPILMAALQLLFIPITRYMYPLTPMMLLLAALLLTEIGAILISRFNPNRKVNM